LRGREKNAEKRYPLKCRVEWERRPSFDHYSPPVCAREITMKQFEDGNTKLKVKTLLGVAEST